MKNLPIASAMFILSMGYNSWAEEMPAWMQPQVLQLSETLLVDLNFERISDTSCDMPIDNFTLTHRGNQEAFVEAPALLRCGDTHFEGVHISIPVMKDGKLMIFSYWNYWGHDFGAPVGAMKATLKISDGKLTRGASQIYYEPGFQYGGRLLRQGAETTAETQERLELISHLENQFAADFVVGAKRDALFAEVQAVLAQILPLYTSQWCQANPPQERSVAGASIGLTPCASR